MLKIQDLCFKINDNPILNNISLDINPGEIMGVIGAPGSGKSTLLKVLMGKIKDYKGDIYLRSHNVKKLPANKKIDRLFKAIPDYKAFSETENIENLLNNARKNLKGIFSPLNEFDQQIINYYVKTFKLEGHLKKRIIQVSDTIVKKVMLAHALVENPATLLLDNPELNLDMESKNQLEKSLNRFVFNGKKNALIASHDINFILKTCDRVVLLVNGEIDKIDMPDSFTSHDFEKLFASKVIVNKNLLTGRPEINTL